MLQVGIGEYAALGTAFCWGISTHAHSAVGRMVGSNAVVLLRTPFQVFFLGVVCLLLGAVEPVSLLSFLQICLSGFTGIALCDLCLYRAIMFIGPQMGVLLQSVSALFTALLGFVFLGEVLSFQAVLGILIVMLGVAVVMSEHGGSTLMPGQEIPRGRVLVTGVSLGLIAAFFMACSYIMLKDVMNSGVSPLMSSMVRASFAMVFLWSFGLVRGWTQEAVQGAKEKPKVLWILFVSNSVSAMGIWFANVSLANAPSGVAASIMGLQPVLVTIVGAIIYKRIPGFRVIVGTLIAFGGTVLLCLR